MRYTVVLKRTVHDFCKVVVESNESDGDIKARRKALDMTSSSDLEFVDGTEPTYKISEMWRTGEIIQ